MSASGKFTQNAAPVSGAYLVLEVRRVGQTESGTIPSSFDNVTNADGMWSMDTGEPQGKPVLGAGSFEIRLDFPSDVNHLPAYSAFQVVNTG